MMKTSKWWIFIHFYVIFSFNNCSAEENGEELTVNENNRIGTQVQYTKALTCLNVKEKPEADCPTIFKLYQGMSYKPLSAKVADGKQWVKISVNKKYYWIEEAQPSNTLVSPVKDDKNMYKIVVKKEERKLLLLSRDGSNWYKDMVYDIAIGSTGDTAAKKKEGDGRTPTGKYYICRVHPVSSYGEDPETGDPLPSFLISYPNQFDAWDALLKGKIDVTTYNSICDSIAAGKVPPQNTPLGSYIMIHGGGSSEDWTLGCIALEDEDMKELIEYLKTGIQVEIK